MAILREVTDLDADWEGLWALKLESARFHAHLVDARLREGIERRSRRQLEETLASGQGRLLAAVEGDTLVGLCLSQVRLASDPSGNSVGYQSECFITPTSRGTTLVLKMQQSMDDWLRAKGITQAELTVMAQNDRAWRLWAHLGFVPYTEVVRKEITANDGAAGTLPPGVKVRRVEDIGADWAAIRPLLQRNELSRSRAEERGDIESLTEKKGRLFLAEAGGAAAGLALGRLVKNPWLFEERIGMVDYLAAAPDSQPLLELLLRQLAGWLSSKGATSIQLTVSSEDAGYWHGLGYAPYFYNMQKNL